jgi:hypothetical protein
LGLGSLLEGTEVFNFMEKISNTLSYWTKREKVVKKKEVMESVMLSNPNSSSDQIMHSSAS